MLSNLGLFYIIIVALFGVPLIATFVVVFIKGVLDFKYAIIFGGFAICVFALFFLVRFFIGIIKKIKRDGIFASRELKEKVKRGERVQVSFLGGLLTFHYGGDQDRHLLDYQNDDQKLLPEKKDLQTGDLPEKDPIDRLNALNDLRERGIIDDKEFQIVKDKIITSLKKPE